MSIEYMNSQLPRKLITWKRKLFSEDWTSFNGKDIILQIEVCFLLFVNKGRQCYNEGHGDEKKKWVEQFFGNVAWGIWLLYSENRPQLYKLCRLGQPESQPFLMESCGKERLDNRNQIVAFITPYILKTAKSNICSGL